jgi:hypothetical protein
MSAKFLASHALVLVMSARWKTGKEIRGKLARVGVGGPTVRPLLWRMLKGKRASRRTSRAYANAVEYRLTRSGLREAAALRDGLKKLQRLDRGF